MLNLSILISTAFSMLVRAAPVFRAWATVKLASRALWPWPPLEVILAISASIFFFFSRAFFSLWVSATFLILTSSSTSLSALPVPLSSLLSSSEDFISFFDAFFLLFTLPFFTNFSSSTSLSSSFISFSAIFLAFSFLLELFFDFAAGAGGSSSEELLASIGVKDFPFLAGLTSSSESATTIKFFIFSSIPLSSPQSSSCFFPFFPFLGGMVVEFSLVEVNQANN